jgi:putative selenium metabolism protein ssnA
MLLIGNGTVFTRDIENPMVNDGGVLIEDDKILKVGKFDELKKEYPKAQILDAKKKLILPAFVNCHNHIYSMFARGLNIKGYSPDNFLEILKGLWWKMDKTLDVKDSELSAAANYLGCIENGVSTLFDHHASYGEIEGSLFAIAEQAKKFGVRSCLCYEISDRNGEESMKKAVKENIDFADYALKDSKNLVGLIGLHASFTLSDETLNYVCEKNTSKYGYHVHVAEGTLDEEACLKEHGMRVVNRLNKFSILGSKSITGHCVHINDEERDIIKETDTMVVNNPESNMGNAIGAANLVGLLESGILVGLGTDGYTADMIESLKFAHLLTKHSRADARKGFNEACKMLFVNNPKMTYRTFGIETGILKAGAMADVIVMDYDEITPVNENNIDAHILFGMNGKDVVTTVTSGVVRMKDREVLGIDKEKLLSQIRDRARDFSIRVNQ